MRRKRERKLRCGAAGVLFVCALATLVMAGATANWAVAGGATVLFYAAHRIMIGRPGLAVLTYHSVSPDASWLPWASEISVNPVSFEAQMKMLKSMGLELIDDATAYVLRAAGSAKLKNYVVVHFDDGYYDNLVHAAPIAARYGVRATIFASLDFIEPEQRQRANGGTDGYLKWSELRELRDRFGWSVQPHGIDHGRIPVSDRAVDTLTEDNWRRHAWLQWHKMPGAKYAWYQSELPPAVPLGSPVPESVLALAGCGVIDGQYEDESHLRTRLHHHLSHCQAKFESELGTPPAIFCWPENHACSQGRHLATQLGYTATTAGHGRNTASEDPAVISRLHVGDRALGFHWPWADAQLLRAQVRLMQGNFYWYPVVGAMNAVRKAVFSLRRFDQKAAK